MNRTTALIFGLTLAAFPFSQVHAQAPAAPTAPVPQTIKVDKITPSFIQTPTIQFQGDQRQAQNNNPNAKWLEIEVQFDALTDILDDLTAKYYVLIGGRYLFTGEVTHVNVLKGQSLYSVMYISPKTMTRVLQGRPAVATAIDDITVQFLDKGQVVGEGSTKPQFQSGWWSSPLAKYTPIDGALLNKNQTPFAPLYWDRYEEIKPPAH